MKKILAIQESSGIDLTGTNQHGFKKTRSTATSLIELLYLMAMALGENQVGLVARLDLSSAFDNLNIRL